MFSERVLRWFDAYGRHDLPWQKNINLYRIWVAEVMLQQTQVKTVIPYYQKFMQAFPDLHSLADVSLDQMLTYWAGLGYYTRARNLHIAAIQIKQQHGGKFPQDFESVLALPGIGRSTAGAILAQALDQRHVILDGNVKRVLTRLHAIDGWPGQSSIEKQLWEIAQSYTPEKRVADYTQAIMDLGATLCTRSKPNCELCPVSSDCQALRDARVNELPTSKPRKQKPVKSARLLLLTDAAGLILLEKRPPSGIWGGLWSLPEAGLDEEIDHVCRQRWGYQAQHIQDGETLRHTFSHFHLDITPCQIRVQEDQQGVHEPQNTRWYQHRTESRKYALPAPVSRILQQYSD